MCLTEFGWTDRRAQEFEPFRTEGLQPGRITAVHRGLYEVQGTEAVRARLRGHFLDRTSDNHRPVIGDWVGYRPQANDLAVIEKLLPRSSSLVRKVPGRRTVEQVLAANIDTVLLLMGLDGDFNPRRLERMISVAYDSGAVPIVVLNKSDVSIDAADQRSTVGQLAPGIPVLLISALTGEGLADLNSYLRPAETFVLVGSSGVGKSTLVNRLLNEEVMQTAEVRWKDSRGRHTTTSRRMFRLPAGSLLIDTPGIRELQLWLDEKETLGDTFSEIERLAAECRFRNCAHAGEPGCAVQQAIDAGAVAAERLESYQKLKRELRYLAIRQDEGAQRAQKRQWRNIHKALRRERRFFPPKGR